MNPKVAIIILNWNGADLTYECLVSLKKLNYKNIVIILVDNGSTPGSLDNIERDFSDVRLIKNQTNLGFTGGNNIGIQAALELDADYLLLLNNDTEVAPDFLDILVAFMESDPLIGVVGPMIYYYDDPDRIWSAGGAVNTNNGYSVSIGEGDIDRGQYSTQQVDYVSGCALLIRRSVVEQVGLLDERMFAY